MSHMKHERGLHQVSRNKGNRLSRITPRTPHSQRYKYTKIYYPDVLSVLDTVCNGQDVHPTYYITPYILWFDIMYTQDTVYLPALA